MRILIFGINYAPELTGIGKYTTEMAAWLARQGHEVAVVTAMPYYPEWEVHDAYKGKKWMKEVIDQVTVYRVPLYVPKTVRSRNRILHEFSFELSLFPTWFSLLLKKKYEVVINIMPPFHLGFYAITYARLKGAKLVTHIQDLQVDAAKDLGMINNQKLLDLMFGMERLFLRKSHLVSTISLGMMRKVAEKGIPESQRFLFPNWVNEALIYPLPKVQSLRDVWDIPYTDKVVLYAGNMGEKQGLEVVIDLAGHWKERRDVHFILVGTGKGKGKLEAMVRERQLANVRFYPLQPLDKLSALLATPDVHLVLQKRSAGDLVMPSKLTGILAAGGCAIVTADRGTSLGDLVEEQQFGIRVEPEHTPALIDALESALTSDLSVYKGNARSYAEAFLAKEAILKAFEGELKTLVD